MEVGDFVSAAYCTKLLADLGADVIKVEPPGGDRARRYGPFRNDIPNEDASGLYVYLNTNKRGIVLNLTEPSERARLDRLLDSASGMLDVNERRTTMARLQRILQDDAVIAQPLWRSVFAAGHKKVQGYTLHPTIYHQLNGVWIA